MCDWTGSNLVEDDDDDKGSYEFSSLLLLLDLLDVRQLDGL